MAVTTGKTTTQSSNLGIKGSGTGPGGMFGGSSTSNSPKSAAPSTNKSGPGATGGAKTANKPSTPSTTAKKDAPKAPAAPAKAPAKPTTSNSQAPKGPAASLAAAKSSLKTAPATVNAQAQLASDKLKSQKPAPKPQSVQGMINKMTPAQNAARLEAVRRGPGVVSGALPGSTDALAQRRTLTAFGNSISEDPSFNTRYGNRSLNMLPKAVIGEAQHEGDVGRAAVANVMMNRLRLGINDPDGYGYLGAGSIPRMMRGIDAAGMDPHRPSLRPNAGYRNTRFGTANYADGLRAVADALSPYSQFSQTATPRTLNATHYYNPAISNPKWGERRSGTPFDTVGNHVFGNAERTGIQVATLRSGLPVDNTVVTRPAVSPPIPQARPWGPPPIPQQRPADLRRPPSAYSGYGTFNPPVAPPAAAQAPIPRPRPPSQNMVPPPGWTPPISRPGVDPDAAPPGYFQQFEMTPQDMENLKQQAMKDFSFGELMEMRKNQEMLPGFMGPITRDVERQQTQVAKPPIPTPRPPVQGPPRPVGGMSFTPGLPGQMPLSQNMTPPPGWTPPPARETLGTPETYIDPSTGIARNPFDTQRGIAGAGMGFTPGLPGPMPPSLPSPGGMSFTPPLPGQQKQFYDRVPQTPGPQPGFTPPQYPGKSPAGTFTTPYDVREKPFRNFANPDLPPGYAERYLQQPAPSEEFSENPIQGPSSPSQEPSAVEDPQVVKERRDRYSNNGAIIGGIIAGPLGAAIGAVLGDQMGKTKPGQRKAIANNPQALTANVQSINQLVTRGGGGGEKNQGLYVTETGFRDVLVQPKKVLKQPEKYTSLEQMLAALAEGKDPETGKTL